MLFRSDKTGKWHFITPDGGLYEWDLKPGANGRRIAILDDSFHLRPELLTQAKAVGSGVASDDLLQATAAKLDRELGLTLAAASNTNWGGLQEKWLRGNGNGTSSLRTALSRAGTVPKPRQEPWSLASTTVFMKPRHT